MKPDEYEHILTSSKYPAALKQWLKTRSDAVIRGIEIVPREELESGQVFHISADGGIKKFIPQIGNRQGKKEDRTTPRICTSANIIDCVAGYASAVMDLGNWFDPDGKWRGGYYIYAFVPEYAFAVKPSLVYDSLQTREMWLTAWSDETAEYIPDRIGKLWVKQATQINQADGITLLEWYCELKRPACIAYGQGNVGAGYYSFTTQHQDGRAPKLMPPDIQPIDRKQYMDVKKVQLDTLSFGEW